VPWGEGSSICEASCPTHCVTCSCARNDNSPCVPKSCNCEVRLHTHHVTCSCARNDNSSCVPKCCNCEVRLHTDYVTCSCARNNSSCVPKCCICEVMFLNCYSGCTRIKEEQQRKDQQFSDVPSRCAPYDINVKFLSQTQHLPLLILSLQGYIFRPAKAIISHIYKMYKRKVLGLRPPPFLHKSIRLHNSRINECHTIEEKLHIIPRGQK
jgi:hypothetical protein